MKLLVDFIESIPKIGKTKVGNYIGEVEKNPETPQVPDIQNYINIHLSKMPEINGHKKYAISGTLVENDGDEDAIPPSCGITPDELFENEI